MRGLSLLLICLAYVIGLGLTGFGISLWVLVLLVGIAGIGFEWASRRFLPGRFPVRTGWILAAIALFAMVHYQVRMPQPSNQDISQFVDVLESQAITVRGTVEELPRLTRNQKMQIWLDVQGLDPGPIAPRLSQSPQSARGLLYLTVPQGAGADVHPGQQISVEGQIYKPQPAKNPGGFDFAKFLQRQGCFAGLRAETLTISTTQPQSWRFNLWPLQRRIIRSQAAQLPYPEGALLSAMVLGGKVVDLPFELKDQFARIGLSHALAASGFQVSLILGVVLAVTQRLNQKLKIALGGLSLLLFLGLTGLQPSVCRAVVMGFAVLWALASERKINPIGSLLFAVTFLLVANPLWIWDLGFQLSVLATLGLVVTVPWLSSWLDWLPNVVKSAIAVPLAALIWTLPLQLQAFGVVSPYCLVANIFTTLLITIVSLGGMVSALIAAVSPVWGSATAAGLHGPIWTLITGVDFFVGLPGSTIAVGTIPVLLMALLYGLLGLLWSRSDLQRYGWAFGLFGAALVWLPSVYGQANLTQITSLATSDQPVLVVQTQAKTGLVNSGSDQTAMMTVLPFLQQQGVNRLDWGLAFAADKPMSKPSDQPLDQTAEPEPTVTGWSVLADRLPLKQMYHLTKTAPLAQSQSLETDRAIAVGTTRFERLSQDPDALSLRLNHDRWLLLGRVGRKQEFPSLSNHQVLWWTGGRLQHSLIRQIQPKVAIAYGKRLDRETEDFLKQQGSQIYWLKRDGAVQWQPKNGFRAMDDAGASLL